MAWRWDQGRLEYLRFDNLRKAAPALVELDGAYVNRGKTDPLRGSLTSAVGLPFAPPHYRVWRNYGRVYKCALLATTVNNKLACTDLCRKLADTEQALTVDEYLSYVVPRFYYPSPVFQGYETKGPQVFPFCSILKLLLARASNGSVPAISIDEIFEYLVANSTTGLEPADAYSALNKTPYSPTGDEPRQVRELVIFVSQFEFLKWNNPVLYLDVDSGDEDALKQIEQIAQPIVSARKVDADSELLSLGGAQAEDFNPVEISSRTYNEDTFFTEGKKVRVVHLKTERSRKLREFFFANQQSPYTCDMCGVDVTATYPWVERLLEVHHLLPLSSPVRVESAGSSIADLIGLCPTCHRAVHAFYRDWLKANSLDDFCSYEQAKSVYEEAKNAINC